MDADEWGRLLLAEVPGLWGFARTLTRDDVQAEDLVQETLARALERGGTFRGDASLATWLHRILHNLAVDSARRSREVPVEDIVDAVEAAWRDDTYTVDAATVAARAQTRADLEDALVHLPLAYRVAVVLHAAEGWTVMQIAGIQSISLAAAKQRLRRGRMMLVSELARVPERRRALRGVPLRCWEARSRISDYLDGEVDDAEATRLVRHLQSCPTCPPLYAALLATRDALREPAKARTALAATTELRDPDTVIPPALAGRIADLLQRDARNAPD
jgi:RNA polymerase sigma-70 factor, ECF subfamily